MRTARAAFSTEINEELLDEKDSQKNSRREKPFGGLA
jgi:hypothetical protein